MEQPNKKQKESKKQKKQKEPKESKEQKEQKEPKEQKESKESKESKEQKEQKESKDPKDINILFTSITTNYIFYLTLFFCLYKFSQNKKYNTSYLQLVLTFIVASMFGYFWHILSHNFNFLSYYKKLDNLITNNVYINQIIIYICTFCDYHDTIHHDAQVNKQPKNIIYELLNNIVVQGLSLIFVIKLLNLLDFRVIVLWTLVYSTVHNINYLIVKPTTHKGHHLNKYKNFGMDCYDILFNTKHDLNVIENHNHGAINLLIVTYLICYLT